MRIAALNVYPVKSLGGIALDAAEVELMGLAGDRRLMLVDPDGTFITQREEPRLAALRARPHGEGVAIDGPDLAPLLLRLAEGERSQVTVWGSEVDALVLSASASAALSAWLGRMVRLVAMDEVSARTSPAQWAPGAPVGFADAFSVLIASAASLDALNARLRERGAPVVPMDRFRANIVVDGAEAWAEDAWATLRVGDVVFDLVKPCARCVTTTTDQVLGTVDAANEPLATLAKFRRSRDRRAPGVMFGWNAVPRSRGRVAVGDPVAVIEERVAWPVG